MAGRRTIRTTADCKLGNEIPGGRPLGSGISSCEKKDGLRLSDFDPAISAAGIVLLLVDHVAFHCLDLNRLEGKSVIDTRGLWSYGSTASD